MNQISLQRSIFIQKLQARVKQTPLFVCFDCISEVLNDELKKAYVFTCIYTLKKDSKFRFNIEGFVMYEVPVHGKQEYATFI